MHREEIINEYKRWCAFVKDGATLNELGKMKGNFDLQSDAFYRHLSFGTGGLRGKLGAGTNRMNLYTVRRATLGLARYILSSGGGCATIGYDTRIMSKELAETAAEVLCSLGIKVYIYSEPLPTPMLSYAVRYLGASVGIMITASHNPAIYNGYKVYGSDGCQITDGAAEEILGFINKTDYFDYEEKESFGELVSEGKISLITDEVYESYLKSVRFTSVLSADAENVGLKIVYTPLNGTGLKPVSDILSRIGYEVSLVGEQAVHDGNFPTCKKPNPELPEALSLGISYLERTNSDILIATDPDCDRIGVVVKTREGYNHLSGNEVGILLLDYILSQKKKAGALSDKAICLKTIVTTPLADKITDFYGAKIKNLLTGFKYIGEEVGKFEKSREYDFVFGFEESCGYLGGDYVRDKDGVYGAMIVSEMAAYYKRVGKTLSDRLAQLYSKFGYIAGRLISFEYEGVEGEKKIASLMKEFREKTDSVASLPVTNKTDYKAGILGLPPADVIELSLLWGHKVIIRPSGTEPKIKLYIFAEGKDERSAKEALEKLVGSKELSL